MARGPETQETKLRKALEAARAFLGCDVELPLDSTEDLLMEASSVMHYYETRGRDFTKAICGQCGLVFEYLYHYRGVKYCTLHCARNALREIGIEWDHSRTPANRWGQYAPAIVPGNALEHLESLLATQA